MTPAIILLYFLVALITGYCFFWIGYHKGFDECVGIVTEAFSERGEYVECKDCEYLMFSDMYGECSKGRKGIVRPEDGCHYGKRKGGGS